MDTNTFRWILFVAVLFLCAFGVFGFLFFRQWEKARKEEWELKREGEQRLSEIREKIKELAVTLERANKLIEEIRHLTETPVTNGVGGEEEETGE